jgi:hypothetical protein
MKLTGYIKFQNKVIVDGQECYGCTRADKQTWDIRISKDALENYNIFTETIMHELLHLGYFVIMASTKQDWSERQQHAMLNKIMPVVMKEFRKHTKED